MENLLSKIIAQKREELERQKSRTSLSKAIRKAAKYKLPIIAEIKRKSPKFGTIKNVNVIETAKIFQNYGACALSILTNKNFDGDIKNLIKLRNLKFNCKDKINVPLFRKDFIIDEIQIYESYIYGADAILLIANVLKEKTQPFLEIARKLNMECMVEIHDEEDLKFIGDAKIVGINTRNMVNFEIDTNKLKLSEKIKNRESRIVVAESGIENKEDVHAALRYADALLIGTSITKNFELLKEFVKNTHSSVSL
ncbi:MAG: indole-3-glycerol phosphate synthase TrpC [Candidatus Altarchaeum sp.]|nr:indole-3-glycerol phosphate synthase TrpC [Candidatus Altarchaeum sp.]